MQFSSGGVLMLVSKRSFADSQMDMHTLWKTLVLADIAMSSVKILLLQPKLPIPIPSKDLLIQEFLLFLISGILQQIFLNSIFCLLINMIIRMASIHFLLPVAAMSEIFTNLPMTAVLVQVIYIRCQIKE